VVEHVAIIGGGPGGYESALVAAQLGAQVTVVDRDGLGGSAVLTDCVPSKTLIATADLMTSVQGAGELGVSLAEAPDVDVRAHLGVVNRRVKDLARAQSVDIAARLEREGVRVISGAGRLDGPGVVVADRTEGGTESLEAQTILVSTGAHPRVLDTAKPDGERILTWEQVYDLPELPETLVVVGSGVTGAEFAGAYLALGSEVVLVSSRDRVLPGEDVDAAEVLEEVFKRRGMTVMSRTRMESVQRSGDGVRVTLTDGRVVEGSHCLLALGSLPNTAGMGLQEAGVELDDGGFIRVDGVSRTSLRGVYAAGDCTGVLMLASVAAMQGRIAMAHALGDAVQPLNQLEGLVERLHGAGDRHGRLHAEGRRRRRGRRAGDHAPAGRQRTGEDAGHPRRLREALLPSGNRHRHRRRRGRAGCQRVHPPGLTGGCLQSHRRPGGARVHGLPVDLGLRRRGGAPPAPSRLTPARLPR
jgi:dihydrolipoamide dehydrogenase